MKPTSQRRSWSLESARALLPEVKKRTADAVARADDISADPAASEKDKERQIGEVLQRWAREMDALGAEVKGPWLVDFDTGAGYYCWKWPEEQLEYFHGYDEGFDGRIRIQ